MPGPLEGRHDRRRRLVRRPLRRDKIQDAAKQDIDSDVAGPGNDIVGLREDNTGLNSHDDVVNCDKGKQDKGGQVRGKEP